MLEGKAVGGKFLVIFFLMGETTVYVTGRRGIDGARGYGQDRREATALRLPP